MAAVPDVVPAESDGAAGSAGRTGREMRYHRCRADPAGAAMELHLERAKIHLAGRKHDEHEE